MPMYYLIEYSNNYSKTYGSLWQYYREEPSLNDDDNFVDFTDANRNSSLFNLKQKIMGQTGAYDKKKC